MRNNAQSRNANLYDFSRSSIVFNASQWRNPALRYFYPVHTYGDVSVSWQQRHEKEIYDVPNGNKESVFDFNAHSFRKGEKYVVYGSAGYQYGVNKNIKWNNIADYQMLYPYLVADTIGGTAYREQYCFNGGYVRGWGKLTAGIYGDYRTRIEYRKLDPRPKSKVSDLLITLGLSVPVSKGHRLGVNADYSSYQQSHSIRVYRPGGSAKLFYLRGFGISDESFSTMLSDNGSECNTYEKRGKGVSVQLFPVADQGYFQSLAFRQDQMELQNSFFDAINQLKETTLQGDLGWKFKGENRDRALKLHGFYHQQKGYEFNYTRNRDLLSKAHKYNNTSYRGGIACMQKGYRRENRKHYYQLGIDYIKNESEYLVTGHLSPVFQNFDNVEMSVAGGLNRQFVRSALNVKWQCDYRKCLDSQLQTSDLAVETANETLVIPEFEYLTADRVAVFVQVRYDLFTIRNFGTYIKGEGCYTHYWEATASNQFRVSLGVAL
ncbi:hypothetical protein DMA11_21065 [Marinilabiliaceae bacterium JC017]|nr:hypothetical protein DMA11_21065 [Marinilabiliaceae bacterium JC017]